MGAGTGEETGRTWDCAAEMRRPPPHPTGRPHTPSSGPSTPGALGRGCRASGVKTGGGVPLAILLPQQKAGAGAAGTLAHTHTHTLYFCQDTGHASPRRGQGASRARLERTVP